MNKNYLLIILILSLFAFYSCDEMDPLPDPEPAVFYMKCQRSKNAEPLRDMVFIVQQRNENGILGIADTILTSGDGSITLFSENEAQQYLLHTDEDLNPDILVPWGMQNFNIANGDSMRLIYTQKKVLKLRVYNKVADTGFDKCDGWMYMIDPIYPYIKSEIEWSFETTDADTLFYHYLRPERRYFLYWKTHTKAGGVQKFEKELIPTAADTLSYELAY